MRAIDHKRIVKGITLEHAQEMRDARHSQECLSQALEYRHGLMKLYEEAIRVALENRHLPESVRQLFADVSSRRDEAMTLYGRGAPLVDVLAVLDGWSPRLSKDELDELYPHG